MRKRGAIVALLAAGVHAAAAAGTAGWLCRMDGRAHLRDTRCCPPDPGDARHAPPPLALESRACCDAFSVVATRAPAEAAGLRNLAAPAPTSNAPASAVTPPALAVAAAVAPVSGAPPGAPPLYLSASSLLI